MEKYLYHYKTPIGELSIVQSGDRITSITFGRIQESEYKVRETKIIKETIKQLNEYFIGTRKEFNISLNPAGTEFQKKVWGLLQNIPYGQTRSYKQIAEMVGNVKACRAVGMANNKNPIPIIIPCHRVVGTNGKLVGYAGGLEVKEKLLEIEKRLS